MSTGKRHVVVTTTLATREHALALAERLVADRLVACAQITPGLTSVYRWNGEVQRDDEVLLTLKTVAARLAALEAAFGAHHPYEVPEFVVTEMVGCSPAYLAFVDAGTSDEDP